MCRSIQRLRTTEGMARDDEIAAAARQFVRKVSGFREPSPKHAEAFERAVADVAEASRRLLETLPPVKAKPAPADGAPERAPTPARPRPPRR